MSPSSVHQGLQSCLEPHLTEPRVLRLKLSPPGLDSDPCEKPFTNTATGSSSWSFLQSLSNICNKTEEHEAENVYVYVHPTVKCSSLMLSAKSLEMCTESLGCETGSSNASDDMSLFSSESSSCFTGDTPVAVNRNSVSKRVNRGNIFPPPLTSLTDLGGVHVRPHREDGRLILEAVTASASVQPYFQAERSNGRLRLRLFESVDCCYEEEEEEESQKQEACGEEDTGIEEYVGNGEDEMEMTKFGRPSSCKESGNIDIFGDGYFELPPLSLCL